MPYSRAASTDGWYRWLLKANEPQPGNSGLIKHFEDMFEAPREERPWLLEYSGKLESLGANFREDADAEAARINAGRKKPSLAYRGRMKASVEAIRSVNFDVFHDPEPNNEAHANVTISDRVMVDGSGKITPGAAESFHSVLAFEAP